MGSAVEPQIFKIPVLSSDLQVSSSCRTWRLAFGPDSVTVEMLTNASTNGPGNAQRVNDLDHYCVCEHSGGDHVKHVNDFYYKLN